VNTSQLYILCRPTKTADRKVSLPSSAANYETERGSRSSSRTFSKRRRDRWIALPPSALVSLPVSCDGRSRSRRESATKRILREGRLGDSWTGLRLIARGSVDRSDASFLGTRIAKGYHSADDDKVTSKRRRVPPLSESLPGHPLACALAERRTWRGRYEPDKADIQLFIYY